MKKLVFLFLAVIASHFTKAQAPCSYTACIPFQNSDLYNVFQAIYSTASSGTAVISGTASIKDNTSDTLNNRLGSMRSALYSSSVSLTDWIVSVDGKLNSIVNQNALLAPNVSTLTVSSSTASSSGTVSAGAKSVGFFTSSTFSGSINGVARNPNTFYSFSTPQTNAVLSAIIYVISAGSVTIDLIN